MAEIIALDANVILRSLLETDGNHHERAQALLDRAAGGEFQLEVSPIILAECIWVMKSVYKYPLSEVTATLLSFLALDGIITPPEMRQTLLLMSEKNVDFADAFLAAQNLTGGKKIATFDKDFRRLGAELLDF